MNIKDQNLPAFPYGAVYYRVSNPPRQDWERDYQTAAEDHNNIFRHWFLWAAIERSPGEYHWEEFDRQLDLAAQNGMRTIIAEMVMVAPDWTRRLYPHAIPEDATGKRSNTYMHDGCGTGGVSMCLDNEDVKQRAEEFLRRLANRYKDHPGLGGYDIWNECNHQMCYCAGTQNKFRAWLKKKYGTIEALRAAWNRPGLSCFEDVEAPRKLRPYNESMDWLKFYVDNGHEAMRWRADIIRGIDPNHRVTAHGLAKCFHTMPTLGTNDWTAAEMVDSYGLTWGSCRHGDEPWRQCEAMDLIRCASRGKPFWHAECYGGPLWLQPQVLNRPRSDGRIATPEDIRYWNLTSYMHGATGSLFLRWRPLLDGALFGAFGPYGMDGSRTNRSEMSTSIAKWAQAERQKALWQSRPVQGDIGILFVPESELFTHCLTGSTASYGDSLDGAYIGFYKNNIQADFVQLKDIDEYSLLYLPYPILLEGDTAKALPRWVENGGTLICEGCPAYWGDETHVGTVQPNQGLNKLFGCEQAYVEFVPDLLEGFTARVLGEKALCADYRQAYTPTEGKAVGWYEDGMVAAVENRFGKGKTLLIGSMMGLGMRHHESGDCGLFAKVLEFAGKQQDIKVSNPDVRVRRHAGPGGEYLWIANYKKTGAEPAVIELCGRSITSAEVYRGEGGTLVDGRLVVKAAPRDVTVLKIEFEKA